MPITYPSRQELLNSGLTPVNLSSLDADEIKCPICTVQYGARGHPEDVLEDPVKIPCGHIYGAVCIAAWLQDNNTCPTCRAILYNDLSIEEDSVPGLTNTDWGIWARVFYNQLVEETLAEDETAWDDEWDEFFERDIADDDNEDDDLKEWYKSFFYEPE